MRSLWIPLGQVTFAVVLSSTAMAHAQEELVPYDGHRTEFTIALPRGWTVYDQLAALTGKASPAGVLIFTSSSPAGLEVKEQLKLLAKLDRGELPSFFVDRSPARQGMTCASFAQKAQEEVVKLVQRSFSAGKVEPPRVESANVGGCRGVQVRVDVRAKDGAEWVTDVRAASDGKTLYLFSLRNHRANFEKNQEFYERAVSTMRLAVAP